MKLIRHRMMDAPRKSFGYPRPTLRKPSPRLSRRFAAHEVRALSRGQPSCAQIGIGSRIDSILDSGTRAAAALWVDATTNVRAQSPAQNGLMRNKWGEMQHPAPSASLLDA